MSQSTGAKASPVPASSSTGSGLALEASVRQLIANGKSRTALENAKQFHKTQPTPASECLLLDAYTACIQSLIDHDLRVEAKALLDLVRERFPSARERFEGLAAAASARGGELGGLLQPLNDPQLSGRTRCETEESESARPRRANFTADSNKPMQNINFEPLINFYNLPDSRVSFRL